ncbi:hypothetical protein ATANTOWER_023116 [Ataeniobius toweri]|uniref:C-type lectin domain-containing protein n=1 Tax=Ataeniobius toweri TaxID=208326 RepID=A0ABU7A7R1_9TELE|nr:hypothetical protein [Ataeniobius toweri]
MKRLTLPLLLCTLLALGEAADTKDELETEETFPEEFPDTWERLESEETLPEAFPVYGEPESEGPFPEDLLEEEEETRNGTDTPVNKQQRASRSFWNRFGGRIYRFFDFDETWTTAERVCRSYAANLASVHSFDEDNFIRNMIRRGGPEAWIGATDAQREGRWFWSDGTHFSYRNWCPREPNNLANQDCVVINFRGSRCWDDTKCNIRRPFICAKRA